MDKSRVAGRVDRIAAVFAAAVLASGGAHGGQMYGSIVDPGQGAVAKLEFTVQCGSFTTRGTTDERGAYRVVVPQRGRCEFRVSRPGDPASSVLSYENPVQYDFQLVRRADGGFDLQRRQP